MQIRQLLMQQGYELDNEEETGEGHLEVWINRSTRRGVLIEWFEPPKVRV